MNFKNIIEIFKRASIPHVKIPLGRWNIHNYRETVIKIKYANEDNCGICSDYNNMKQKKELDDDKEYIYMMGYESVH